MSWGSLIDEELGRLKALGRYRELVLPQGIDFTHNDYLGLSRRPEVIEAGICALKESGAGSRGSRLLGGNYRLIEAAEARLAAFFRAPACLFFPTGYAANLSAVRVLAELSGHVVSDERNHASLIDGIRLARVPKTIVPHQQWEEARLPPRPPLVISESLFSMDGDFVRWDEIKSYLERSDGFCLLDEAHAAGVFLEDGRGVNGGWSNWERLAVVVTFGKAFGVSGAAVLGSERLKSLLVNKGRSFIYTTASSPAIPAMVMKATEILDRESDLRVELWRRAEWVRSFLHAANLPLPEERSLWEKRSPILPLSLPGEDKALRFCEVMRKLGVQLRAIRHPTVAVGSERVRLSLSLLVGREEMERAVREIVVRWTEYSSLE